MADPRAVVRLLDELVWRVRREGARVSTAQAIDLARAVTLVGIEDREALITTVISVLACTRADRDRVERAFVDFFSGKPARTLFDRLEQLGFTASELDALRELLSRAAEDDGQGDHLGALLEGGSSLDQLMQLAGMDRALSSLVSPMQAGFFAMRMVDAIGVTRARQKLAGLRAMLVDALGERGEALTRALEQELDRAADDVRARVRERSTPPAPPTSRNIANKAFEALSQSEVGEVRRAVRSFAARLRGAERARKRRALHGRIDPHRTLRSALRTGGVPFAPARRKRRRDRPRLVILCDVSDSVRSVATFLLEFAYAAQELFSETRSFVFVSELGETTELFARHGVHRALAAAYGGGIVSVTDNSNYGRVLRSFEERSRTWLDRRTTVVVLGDGRTNYHDDASDALARIRDRARALIWLCPEPRAHWASGDSAMSRYARVCTTVLEVRSASDLESAARRLLVR